MSVLSKPYFHNEEAAFTFLESIVWRNGQHCPHCGAVDRLTKVKANPEKRIRLGLWRCGHCKKQFTAKISTVFEHGRIPLHLMLQATYLMVCSKKGISAHQLHRVLGITYKSAWFLAHRIREAMRSNDFTPFGTNGGTVEVDETFIGRNGKEKSRAYWHKNKILSLVDRSTGRKRSIVMDKLSKKTVLPILQENIAREAKLMTDESGLYHGVDKHFSSHDYTVHNKGNYVNPNNPLIHTNTIEGAFSIFKRGMKGVYQHCSPKHLHRYVAEFDFRYSNREKMGIGDCLRFDIVLSGLVGKRLSYR